MEDLAVAPPAAAAAPPALTDPPPADGAPSGALRVQRSPEQAEQLVLDLISAHADSLLRTARRYSLCADDAQDAYQRGLEILMHHAARLDAGRVAGWLHTVVKHEALAINKARCRIVGGEEVDLDAIETRTSPSPEDRVLAFEQVARSAEALQRLKPQEVRALWLKAMGNSYQEICDATGWSYTKVNRCLAEGRKSFLARYAGIEEGDECRRWAPVLSAMVDGRRPPSSSCSSGRTCATAPGAGRGSAGCAGGTRRSPRCSPSAGSRSPATAGGRSTAPATCWRGSGSRCGATSATARRPPRFAPSPSLRRSCPASRWPCSPRPRRWRAAASRSTRPRTTRSRRARRSTSRACPRRPTGSRGGRLLRRRPRRPRRPRPSRPARARS